MPHASKVTVVIPTYNRARWLPEAIESVLAQTWDELSLVVSDNASTDSTREVVARFRDPRLVYVRQSTHMGLNEHFTHCLQLGTQSRYVFLLPDDDLMLGDLLAEEVKVLDAHPQVGFVHSEAEIIDTDGQVIEAVHNMTRTLTCDMIEPGQVYIRETMQGGYRVHGSTVLFRSKAVAGEGYRDSDYPATDFALMLRLALAWDIAFIAKPLAAYRVHGGTYTAEAGAESTAGGYIQGTQMIKKIRDVKLNFLSDHCSGFLDQQELRAAAYKSMRRDLVIRAGRMTPERSFRRTAGLFVQDLKIDPKLAFEPTAWRLLAANMAGAKARRAVRSYRQLSGSKD